MNKEILIKTLDKKELNSRLEELIELEPFWTDVGETLWREENLRLELIGKFDLSKIALIDNKVAGYLIGSIDKNEIGKLNKIVVSDVFKGNGIGSMLWNYFLETCRKKNLRKLEFKVLLDNIAAINLYEKKGCVFDGIEIGNDEKKRHNVHYIFYSPQIAHSKPTIENDDADAAMKTILTGNLARGKKVDKLIDTFCNYTQKKYAIAVNSGANAIFLALRSLGVNHESEVILPSYLCGSVLHAVEMTRAKAIFADINSHNFNISHENLEKKITKNTKAIIVTHLFGKMSDINKIKSFGIHVIEDCAQAMGAGYNEKPVGSFGDISIFSFYPTKMIGSGTGGMALSNDEKIYEKMFDLLKNDNRVEWGEAYSMNMNDICASIALNQFSKLQKFKQARNKIAQEYNRYLSGADFTLPKYEQEDICFRYVLRHQDAFEIINNLNKRGISANRPVFRPLHQYKNLLDIDFPNTCKAFEQAISLPIYPSLSNEQIINVVGALVNSRYEK